MRSTTIIITMQKTTIYTVLIISLLMTACQTKPKVIESQPVNEASTSHVHNLPETAAQPESSPSAVHKVVVAETLDADRYTYLRVTENESEYWVAIPRQEIEVGATYFFQGGLLKRNFKSQEYDRIFETLYLVSGVEKERSGSAIDEALAHNQKSTPLFEDAPITASLAKDIVKLSELMADPGKYEGKRIVVAGKCVKVNPMIMGRNWVHIQDGSTDGTDLTITTTENIPLGATVSMEGTIALNKDFGAGYRYDVIMEGAVLK